MPRLHREFARTSLISPGRLGPDKGLGLLGEPGAVEAEPGLPGLVTQGALDLLDVLGSDGPSGISHERGRCCRAQLAPPRVERVAIELDEREAIGVGLVVGKVPLAAQATYVLPALHLDVDLAGGAREEAPIGLSDDFQRTLGHNRRLCPPGRHSVPL